MKTAVSIPNALYGEAEELAKRLGLPRSRLYAAALREYLDRHGQDGVTQQLDAVYAAEDSSLDTGLAALQWTGLEEEW